MCQRTCEAYVELVKLGRQAGRGAGSGAGWGWGVCNSVACESSDAAPSRLSTWLEVLIQLSLLDHHYIDSAAQKAGTLTELMGGSLTVCLEGKKPRCCAVGYGWRKRRRRRRKKASRSGLAQFFLGARSGIWILHQPISLMSKHTPKMGTTYCNIFVHWNWHIISNFLKLKCCIS